MTTETTKEKLLPLGRLNKRTKDDGTVYFTGSVMIHRLREATTFTDGRGNEKIGLVIFKNDYKKEGEDSHEPDFKIYQSKEPPKKKTEGDDFPF